MTTTQTESAYIPPKSAPHMSERECILQALSGFISQRPGLDFGNYGDVSAYRSELRSIGRDLNQARTLLAAVSWRESITAEHLKAAMHRAYSGRLSWHPDKRGLSYCTGQYWPTEYRRAVCAVLASALWGYFRNNMPTPDSHDKDGNPRYNGKSAGEWLRWKAKREFGRAIGGRWFS